jgi:hypothetical protein
MATLEGSVGHGGKNHHKDVRYVQEVLNKKLPIALSKPVPITGMVDDDQTDDPTILAIEELQKKVLQVPKPDGRVDPGGKTLQLLMKATLPEPHPPPYKDPARTPPTLTESDFTSAAQTLNCEVAAIKAVNQVESRGAGFLHSGRPKILFERHKFSSRTNGAYDASYPEISNPAAGGYGAGGEHQYDRLIEAMACDRTAALKSASWGRFQVMGFNYQLAGFASVDDMVNKMYESEGQHLKAFINYVKNTAGLAAALREHRWVDFARGYNGPDYRKNDYDGQLKRAYDSFKAAEEQNTK